jgi:F-type H+-transporting ATPase subunit b
MIEIDISILVEIVSVLALMLILNSILFKPIRGMLEERAARIASIQGDVEKYERNAQQLLDDFNAKLADARRAGQEERDGLKHAGRDEERGIVEASTTEAEAKKQELMAGLSADIDAARKNLAAKADAFAVEIAQKLLGRAV